MSSTGDPSRTGTPGNDAGVFLGVDGGGTKTAFPLLTGDGAVLATALAPSCYYLGQSIELVEEVLRAGIGSVCDDAGIRPSGSATRSWRSPGTARSAATSRP